ncbi:MAG TPA: hypothetical protein VLE93_00380 [Candidatus Saccharimonadales bacterium]|nr:hypothetical protein [Candidatus Saccharimonadales bacterium]
MRKGGYLRFASFVVALTVILQVSWSIFLPAQKAYAHGDYFFTPINTPSANRTDDNTIIYSGRLEANENGLKNDNLGSFTLSISLNKVGSAGNLDRWGISSVSFSNVGASTDNANAHVTLSGSSKITVTNAANESISYDYSNPSAPGYGFIVGQANSFKGYAITLYDHFGSSGETAHGNGPGTDLDPVAGLTRGPERPVTNYGQPNSTAPISGDDIKKWTDAFTGDDKNLRIVIPDQSQPNNPPYAAPVGKNFVPADKDSGRPPLIFKLVAASFSATFKTVKWLIFQAYQVDSNGKNPQIVSNFYLLVNDCSAKNGGTSSSVSFDCFDLIYDTDQASVYTGVFKDDTYPGGAILINGSNGGSNIGGLAIPNDGPGSINEIFGYVLDVPKDGSQNCLNGGVYTTGPPKDKPDGQTVQDIQKKYSVVDQGAASNLSSSCASKAGWPAYWNIKVNNQVISNGGGTCGFNLIFQGDLGKAFNQLIDCLFTEIFQPAITWAAQLVTSAAGVSYAPPPDTLAARWPNHFHS